MRKKTEEIHSDITQKRELCPTCGQQMPSVGLDVQAILDQLSQRASIRMKLLRQLVPFSEATLWRKVGKGDFPKPVKISDRITAWRGDEVRKWFVDHGLAN